LVAEAPIARFVPAQKNHFLLGNQKMRCAIDAQCRLVLRSSCAVATKYFTGTNKDNRGWFQDFVSSVSFCEELRSKSRLVGKLAPPKLARREFELRPTRQ
jgi:hypothetical protein